VARLFRAISFAETRHARNHLRVMGGIGTTAENLRRPSRASPSRSTRCTPPTGDREDQEMRAGEAQHQVRAQGREDHKRMYSEARESVSRKTDVADEPVGVCLICGHTVIGELPDKCPVCAAAKEYYRDVLSSPGPAATAARTAAAGTAPLPIAAAR
jgi:rubrerythrin